MADSQAAMAKRASATFAGFGVPAVSAASAESSMSHADLFCRSGTSSARSSLDSQEQQSERTLGVLSPDIFSSSASITPRSGQASSPSNIPAAATAAAAAAAAFSAFYGGQALCRVPSLAVAPLGSVQLTIQPLDTTSRASTTDASRASFAAADALCSFSAGAALPKSAAATKGQSLRQGSDAASSQAPERCPDAVAERAWSTRTSSGGAQSSDDSQSRQTAVACQPLSESVPMDLDGPQMRAAVAMANRRSALLRFRRKREARTFDKKVRYASRKRLAEARPRVRGQFVKAEVAAAFLAQQAAAESEASGAAPMEVMPAVSVVC